MIPRNIKEMFSLMTFENTEEEQMFLQYMKTRGIYFYKQVYEALVNWMPQVDKIKYKMFSNLIRYDKSIRDKLYIYLAAAEEYLRNIIFDELEIDDSAKNMTNVELDIEKIRERKKEDGCDKSELYYYSYAKNFDLGLIEKIFKKFGLAGKYNLKQEDITETRKLLRNKVMHHNMLLLSCFTERTIIEKEIKSIERGIEALYRILPTNELKKGSEKNGNTSGGLIQAINKSNFPDGDITKEPYNNIICLHKFKDGRFID